MVFPFGNNQEMLQGPCVTVTQEKVNSFTEKTGEIKTGRMCGSPLGDKVKKITGTPEGWNSSNEKMNRKLSKNVCQST